jgi:DNA topoisomerase-1
MTVAQKLYEAGKISYMRTDSLNLSQFAIDAAKDEITKAFGQEFVFARVYKTKSESAQEAHEAIRPTDFAVHEAGNDRNEQRLYELIWKRAIASQMADAQLEKTTATIGISTLPQTLTATGEVIKFEGFLKVYLESTDDEDGEEESGGNKMLPPLEIGQILLLQAMKALERYSRPAPRFTEAALVKKLEEMGIGRPSTYAPTISTIQKRGYIIKENRDGKDRNLKELVLSNDKIVSNIKTELTGQEKSKLFPTDIAMIVNDFLVQHFPNITDYSFTATVEKEFDDIANGKVKWDKMIEEFYGSFHEKVESTEAVERSSVGTSKDLGFHPTTGEKIIARLGRFGPIVQIGETVEGSDKKPQFASLRKGQLIENINLEDALELFKLPREAGLFEEKGMVVSIGRFGPYIKHDSKFYSLKKEDDPHIIDEQRCIELIQGKRKADSEKLIKEFAENSEIKVLNGRFGPYIVAGKKNVKIPKGKEPCSLTLQECLDLAEATPDKPSRFAKKAPAATKTAAVKKPAAKKKTTTAKKTVAAKKATAVKKKK